MLRAVGQRVQRFHGASFTYRRAISVVLPCRSCLQRSNVLRDVEGLQSAMELAESARRQYNESGIAALAAVPSLAGSPYVVEEPAKQVGTNRKRRVKCCCRLID